MSGSCGWFPLDSKQIQAWVERHAHELPQTLDEMAQYPIRFRTAIVNAMPADRRNSLWRAHLETFLEPASELNASQRRLVADAIIAFPVIFSTDRDAATSRMKELESRMRVEITPEQAHRIFGTLGPMEPPEGLPLPADAVPTAP